MHDGRWEIGLLLFVPGLPKIQIKEKIEENGNTRSAGTLATIHQQPQAKLACLGQEGIVSSSGYPLLRPADPRENRNKENGAGKSKEKSS